MKSRVWVCAIAVLFAAPALAGGGAAGDFELGVYTGYAFMDDYGTGATALNLEDDVLFGARAGWFFTPHWSMELSFQRLSTNTQPALTSVDIDSGRFNFLYNFRAERSFRPYLTLGAGIESIDAGALLDTDDASYNGGFGLRWFISHTWGLRLDARYVRTQVGGFIDEDQNDVEVSYGLLWAFGGGKPGDSDGDGVSDRKDKCPDTPAGAIVDGRGCPIDGDGDGVADGIDRCPDTQRGIKVDAQGCALDTDGDGVPDSSDFCPDTPRGATVDSTGCPSDKDGDGVYEGIDRCPDTPAGATVNAEGCPMDSDGDGVYDGIDRCPDTPRGATVDAQGCPKDSDGDGVPDGIDRCPGTPRGTRVDSKGCQILFEEAAAVVLEGVTFGNDSTELGASSRAILDRMARILVENPQLRVEVAGYTNTVGNENYNLDLSGRRASAVRDYLVSKGVGASRLVARGYGEADPIADNGTAAGREKNRRVELRKLD